MTEVVRGYIVRDLTQYDAASSEAVFYFSEKGKPFQCRIIGQRRELYGSTC